MTVNNSDKKCANVVECYEGIKERFEVSPKASRNTLSTRERRSLRSRGENFLEDIEEEKDHLKSSDLLDSNKQESLIPPHMEQEQEEQNDKTLPIRMRKQWSKVRRPHEKNPQ